MYIHTENQLTDPYAERSNAYTLIEVLIVLVLLSTVILLISLALDIHLRQMVINRTEVEEAQLAKVLLNKIAKDIRSVVIPLQEESLEVDTMSLALVFGLASGDLNVVAELTTPQTTTPTTESAAVPEDGEEPLIYGLIPGIYGGIDWIQIDTALLPRGELYGSRQIRRGTSLAADRLSASKTVLYYLGQDTGTLATDDPRYQPERLIGSLGRSNEHNALQYGLYRRQLDRQAMQYAVQEGLDWEYAQDDETLAPEVEVIEFYYFDPSIEQLHTIGDWVEEWDMDERQMLPAAVMVVVGIRRSGLGHSVLARSQTVEREPIVYYSLVIPIPITAEIPEEESTDDG